MEWTSDIVDFLADFGIPIFLALYFLAKALPVPSWPFPVAAGAWFGFGRGFALAIAMVLTGSTSAFLISRYLLRGRIQARIKHHPTLKAIDAAMRDGGWKAVCLFQMSPAIPFGLQNYFLGASKVTLRSYLAGTALAALPAAAILVGVGAGARIVSTLDEEWQWAGLAAGVAATIVLGLWMGRLAKRKLRLA